jgi:hypothetical protein
VTGRRWPEVYAVHLRRVYCRCTSYTCQEAERSAA